MMVNDFGFGLDDLRKFMLYGLDGAWIDDTQRRQWRTQWSEEFDALRGRLARPVS
jgi:adenosine deaminase